MANGVPVRLSADLAARARTAATTQERSLTEQVEHWARLGQVVEDAVLTATVQRLKARSHDPELSARITRSMTSEGQARAAELIRSRNAVLHGIDAKGSIQTVRASTKRR